MLIYIYIPKTVGDLRIENVELTAKTRGIIKPC